MKWAVFVHYKNRPIPQGKTFKELSTAIEYLCEIIKDRSKVIELIEVAQYAGDED